MAGKRLTVEDLWKLDARPADAIPDGAQVCVSVSSFDMKENQARASLWLLSAFGGEPRRLTSCGEKDGEPRWSPDGRWIAFVAKRPARGATRRRGAAGLPDRPRRRRGAPPHRHATGAFGIKWLPDSRRIAFLSWVWPDAKGWRS
jgi:dipeptidyl aminopeptidase/acylaminoacyl peptidase